jgi:hypothetical protein
MPVLYRTNFVRISSNKLLQNLQRTVSPGPRLLLTNLELDWGGEPGPPMMDLMEYSAVPLFPSLNDLRLHLGLYYHDTLFRYLDKGNATDYAITVGWTQIGELDGFLCKLAPPQTNIAVTCEYLAAFLCMDLVLQKEQTDLVTRHQPDRFGGIKCWRALPPPKPDQVSETASERPEGYWIHLPQMRMEDAFSEICQS